MEWLYSLFLEHSALQAVVVLSLISAIGLGLGRVHFWGISLGVTFVFFAGILAGHFGLSVDPQMLNYAESFGLVIFVYSLGLQVGPGFFSSFRKGGVTLNMLALGVVLLGTLLTVVASYATGISLPDMVGILCGATTNTPALGSLVRIHWSIESMHWLLDYNLLQDKVKRKSAKAARNLDTIQRIVHAVFSIWKGLRKKRDDKRRGMAELMCNSQDLF